LSNKTMNDNMRQLETSSPKEAENESVSLETLRNLQKEILLKLTDLWRHTADDRRSRSKKFKTGLELLKAVMDSIKLDPDLLELDQIREVYETVSQEVEIARRNGILPEVSMP